MHQLRPRQPGVGAGLPLVWGPIRPAAAGSAAALPGPIAGVDQGSLLAIGGALGTIAAAIVIGLLIGGILPPAPPVAVASPTPNAVGQRGAHRGPHSRSERLGLIHPPARRRSCPARSPLAWA